MARTPRASIDEQSATAADSEVTEWAGPSRSQKKRDARAVTDLGERLLHLSPTTLARLPIDDELREALHVGQTLQRAARARQLRRLGKLLRERDHAAIAAAMNEADQPSGHAIVSNQLAQQWLVRLVEGGDADLGALLAEHPEADRRQLRQLLRRSQRQPSNATSERARRALLRALRELLNDAEA